jgi:hypothetical protein
MILTVYKQNSFKISLISNLQRFKECTHEIRKVSMKEAKELGYAKICGWEN